MDKRNLSTEKQLSLDFGSDDGQSKVVVGDPKNANVVTFIDAKTREIRREAIELVARSRIFSIAVELKTRF